MVVSPRVALLDQTSSTVIAAATTMTAEMFCFDPNIAVGRASQRKQRLKSNAISVDINLSEEGRFTSCALEEVHATQMALIGNHRRCRSSPCA